MLTFCDILFLIGLIALIIQYIKSIGDNLK